MGISLKVNIIVQWDFKLTYYKITVQHISHFAMDSLPSLILMYDPSYV